MFEDETVSSQAMLQGMREKIVKKMRIISGGRIFAKLL
jgi:hypothetical protein